MSEQKNYFLHNVKVREDDYLLPDKLFLPLGYMVMGGINLDLCEE